jgi:hypothetical protein
MTIRWALAIAVALGFATCGYFMVWDWDKALLGIHNFRQTQTAISAYWMIKEGISFDYQTPVLGKPWVIPFEAPFYQIFAVWVTELFSIDLDEAGRAVSVAFWFACLYPLLGMLRGWIADPITRWAAVLLVWSTPTYLYWSDSFMMESTAMFFSLFYIFGLIESLRRNSISWLAVATVFGTLASLQKATTFLIAAVPAAAFVLLELYRRRGDGRLVRDLIGLAIAGIVPLVALEWWTKHADSLKLLNPLAKDFITSAALGKWNFGTWDQRVSGVVWERIIYIESQWGMGRGSFWFLLAAVLTIPFAIWRGKHRIEIIILALSSLTGALVFTNLFYIHEYYNFEVSLYLDLACALAIIDLVELIPIKIAVRKNRHAEAAQNQLLAKTAIACGIFFVSALWGLFTYTNDTIFVPSTSKLPTSAQVRQALAPVTNAGNPQDVILIYGWDWNPLLPYYSGRKAIMDKETRPLDEPHMQAALAQLSPDQHIAGMMVMGDLANNTDFLRDRITRLHLNSTPVMLPWGPFFERQQ